MGKKMRLCAGLGLVAAASAYAVAPRRSLAHDELWEQFRGWRYAHRGLFNVDEGVPENSLTAFKLAAEQGYGAELDVHLTADKQLVLCHDSNLKRVTGSNVQVENLTLAQVHELSLLGSHESLPTLDEVLELFDRKLYPERGPLIVEIKPFGSNYAELTRLSCEAIDRHAALCCIESFDPRVLLWLRRNRPDFVRGQLAMRGLFHETDEPPITGPTATVVEHVLAALLANVASRPDFVAYRYEDRNHLLRRLSCDVLGAKSVEWTIKDPDALRIIEQAGSVPIFDSFRPKPRS